MSASGECAQHFRHILAQLPLPPVLSRAAVVAWACGVHNEVNRALRKDAFDCAIIGCDATTTTTTTTGSSGKAGDESKAPAVAAAAAAATDDHGTTKDDFQPLKLEKEGLAWPPLLHFLSLLSKFATSRPSLKNFQHSHAKTAFLFNWAFVGGFFFFGFALPLAPTFF